MNLLKSLMEISFEAMNNYRYKALNKSGSIEAGNYECENMKKLMLHLQKKELILVKAITVSKKLDFGKIAFHKKMTYKQLSLFCKQVASILDSGMPLVEAFTILSMDYKGILKQNMVKIINGLSRGETLYSSMASCTNMFPDFMLQMIRIGEYSGKLDKIFLELSIHFHKQYKLKQKLINAATYPMIVFIMSQIAVLFLMTTIVPSMMELIRSSGGKIPLLTKIMFSISDFIKNNIFLIIAVALIISFYCFKIISKNKLDIYVVLKHIRFLAKINKKVNSYKILRAVNLIYSSGGNIVNALESSSGIVNSKYLKKQIFNSVFSIKKGMAISNSLKQIEVIDSVTIALIKLGEGAGKLEDMLSKAINILEDDVDGYINRFSELIQPISILFLAIVVATIMFAVMIPMFTLYNTI
ncbi:type II secretion system protein F [Clostridium oryzae]|uniref:Type II secretion system protein F n=2 Tax=Clostridium oryzae TaxID=1450648 RepID=A0A1V4IT66_9CLOT|nr:type II secretion system protein F [Clostridium oryzae]